MNCQPILPRRLQGTIDLPASKSLSARALIIGALAGGCRLHHLSDCDDTRVLKRALEERLPEIDIQAAGTAMRFATAYFSTCPGETHLITGTARMQQRPIGVLVEALRRLGADIEYAGNEGYPPLRIRGRELTGGEVELPANVSSQYISALLMIGPALRNGLRLRLVGEVISRPYIDMTLALMHDFGAKAGWTSEQELYVAPDAYRSGCDFRVEPDWSAASYWYELMALVPDAESSITLPGLRPDSRQGDSQVQHIFRQIGVHTAFTPQGAVLTRMPGEGGNETLEADFTACPDLAQTLVATCAALGRPFRFTGLQSLRIKETDRIAALQTECARLGIVLTSGTASTDGQPTEVLELRPEHAATSAQGPTDACIATYDDHRMAMAFAPLALLRPGLRIAHPEVVSKSYPAFWTDLTAVGADIRYDGNPIL